MTNIYKKLIVIMTIFAVLIAGHGTLFAATTINLDGIEDSGISPGLSAYLRFTRSGYPDININKNSTTQFTTSTEIYDYAADTLHISDWVLESAGNIWSNVDLIVGETLDLSAGTYRISPTIGEYNAYEYDSFDWDDAYKNLYWWNLYITAQNVYVSDTVAAEGYYELGSRDGKATADKAFNDVYGSYRDIHLAEGGSLTFYIWDWNSIDNSGGLSFKVEAVPLPPTLILMLSGFGLIIIRDSYQRCCRYFN